MKSSYIKSFVVDKLLAAAASNQINSLVTGFNLVAYQWRRRWMAVVPGTE